MIWPSRLAELLGIRLPIIQGAFGGFRSERLVAEVSNAGALGSIGANALEPAQIGESIAQVRALTTRPFSVNLWLSTADEGALDSDRAAFERARAALVPYFAELGAPLPEYAPPKIFDFDTQARAVLDARPAAFSFIFGVPPREILQECRLQGIRTLAAATTPTEAVALEEAGIDAVVASGFEAGGHRGSFLESAERSLVGTFSLVPQVVDAVGLPVVAAGGVADARGVLAALALGADAVQIGTALLAAEGSGASDAHRQALTTRTFTRTGLTQAFTGRLARGLDNRLLQELRSDELLPYPLQRALVRSLTNLAEPAGRSELVPMWAGQSAGLSRGETATAFLDRLEAELGSLARTVVAWRSPR